MTGLNHRYFVRNLAVPPAGFTPASVTGLLAWYDASVASSITSSSGSVSQWNDLSGNGHHFVQGTGANQPVTNTRTENSLNVLDFTLATSYMQTTNTVSPCGNNRLYWCVFSSDAFPSNDEVMWSGTASQNDSWRTQNVDGGATNGRQGLTKQGVEHNVPSGQSARTAGTAYSMAMQYFSGGTFGAYLGGVLNGSLTTNGHFFGGAASVFQIGDTTSGYGLDGKVCEIVIADADSVANGDLALLSTYSLAKWGV